MDEQFFNNHYVRTDNDSNIIRGFSDSFEQPQNGDVLINPEGGYQFRLFPDGEENPPLCDTDDIPLYKWDGTQVVERTPEEIEADRLAQEQSPQAQIARLNVKIHNIPTLAMVVAHIYDTVNALYKTADLDMLKKLDDVLIPINSELSDAQRSIVQLENEPSAMGRSEWREAINERERLLSRAN